MDFLASYLKPLLWNKSIFSDYVTDFGLYVTVFKFYFLQQVVA